MMIIDFHTHAFPDPLAAGALAQLTQNAARFADLYGELVPHTDGTLKGLQASGKQAGIQVSLIQPIATSAKPSHSINDFAALADREPGLRSFGSVHPRNPEWREELERLAGLGLLGIKLHPEYQGCYVDDPETVQVVKEAGRLGLTVLFHAGVDIGMPPPVHCTPERVARLREKVPDTRLILAHMGGDHLWKEAGEILPQLNVYIDTSHAIPEYPEQWPLFAQIIRAMGTDRVLFGTDSPWMGQDKAVETTRRFLQDYRFTPEDSAAILGGNAARLLRIQEEHQ